MLRPPLGSPYYFSQSFAKRGTRRPSISSGRQASTRHRDYSAGGSDNEAVLTRVDLVTDAIDHAIELGSTGT